MPVEVVLDSSGGHALPRLLRGLRTAAAAALLLLATIALIFVLPAVILVGCVVGGVDGLPLSDAGILVAATAVMAIRIAARRAGRKLLQADRELVLFLRRFGYGDATTVATFAVQKTIGGSWRLVTLDDAAVAPVGLSTHAKMLVSTAGRLKRGYVALAESHKRPILRIALCVPWVIFGVQVARGQAADPYVEILKTFGELRMPFDALAPSLQGIFAAGTILTVIWVASMVLVAVVFVLQIPLVPVVMAVETALGELQAAEQTKQRSINGAQEIDAVADQLVADSRKFFAPRLVVLTVASAVWQPTVTRLASAGALTIIDVSEPSPHLLWEIRELTDRLGPRCLFIGECDRLAQLTASSRTADPPEPIVEQLRYLLDGERVLGYMTDPAGMRRFARALRGELLAAAAQYGAVPEQAPHEPAPSMSTTPAEWTPQRPAHAGSTFDAALAHGPQGPQGPQAPQPYALELKPANRRRKQEELHAYDDVIARYGDAREPALQERVVNARLGQGTTLAELGYSEKALLAFDDIVARCGGTPEPSLQARVAEAMVNRGVVLSALGRYDEELAAYDGVVASFGDAAEPALQEFVADALVNKGVALGELDRADAQLEAYDEVVARFGEAPEPALRERVATALAGRCSTLHRMGRREDVLAAAAEVVARCADAPESALAAHVADALVIKSTALCELGRVDEALAVQDDVASRYAASSDPALSARAAEALLAKGAVLDQLGRPTEARDFYDEMIARYGMTSPVGAQALAARVGAESRSPSRAAVAILSHAARIQIRALWRSGRSMRRSA